MADKKLNEVNANSTVDYVIGTLSNGNVVRISKADLAEVMKGLLELESKKYTQGLLYRGVPTFSDWNKAEMGIWTIYGNQNTIDNSPDVENYGTVLCFGDSSDYFVVQIAFPRNNNRTVKFRLRNDRYNNTWTSWKDL